MEYLITYGWALLVIFIVIAALVVINPISTPASCSFPSGFGCPNIPAIDKSGNLYVRVVNSNNNEINVLQAICTADKTAVPPQWAALSTHSVSVARQDILFIDTDTGLNHLAAKCCRADGCTYQAGEEFTGKLWLLYRNSEDPSSYPNRTVSGIISTKIG